MGKVFDEEDRRECVGTRTGAAFIVPRTRLPSPYINDMTVRCTSSLPGLCSRARLSLHASFWGFTEQGSPFYVGSFPGSNDLRGDTRFAFLALPDTCLASIIAATAPAGAGSPRHPPD